MTIIICSLNGKTNICRFEPCRINIKMKNLKNKQIVKVNDLKFRVITQKRLFNTRSIYKNVLEYFSIILENDKRFYAYF